jgi:hypothetical protein
MKDQSILIALQLYSYNTLRIKNSQQCVQADKYLSTAALHYREHHYAMQVQVIADKL